MASPMPRSPDYDLVLDSPLGRLALRCSGQGLTALDYVADEVPLRDPCNTLSSQAAEQLRHYFKDPSFVFDLPLDLQGTPFQQRIWSALIRIPSGKVLSYGALARLVGSGPRAIGGACRANPLPVIVPCHRVISTRGGLGGYGGATCGAGLEVKSWLLVHEGALSGFS
ncbi:methylated-DNA--[protein]-cysteine S-methyltransferase [Ectothiorhodospira lacustris]|uniref:methylated-DNA--[protein]-cysteine S-methyltransferase n=1 Tax=Ectothiorhodospira lacustris TaxID=2899127 RepID=UPI001EE963A2|nr:methylated-DNA--[protein]-cysteine S-methyltransferase [Ectothiorhodospira lacustris]MCG5499401.1 methylated-DNA--[protein]-cysteine S-methyltransferase [Ectothiorhodospira lacustris]MCG5511294.1 methylated-DNA--[protein]-cysteine S-methyltransferase [Ectothiorhodospira lacustris]MCG5523022.1 methylated-DNA--[protein]-cysteine S-methyltransferase [Ectothiorhodospira lacustris]